jgi:hypothetical protein
MKIQPVPTFIRRLWWGLVGCAFLAGICLLALSFSAYTSLQKIAGVFAADHNAHPFTLAFYSQAVLPTRLAGGVVLLLAAACWAARAATQRWLAALITAASRIHQRYWSDASLFWRDVIRAGLTRITRWEWVYLGSAVLFAAACRLPLLNGPMQHDESYTVIAFASRSLWTAISDYHLPNNHVFHTILVHFSIAIFGNQPWSVRIPAFLAGILTIPAIYFLAKRLYGRRTAILAAGLASPAGVLAAYATDARGYAFIILFTLAAALLAADLVTRKNWMGWSLFILTSALGFYTIPIFLFPFGILLTWLVFETISGDALPAYANRLTFLKYLAAAGLAVIVLTGLFYTPILAQSGVKSLFGNSFIGSSQLKEYPSRVIESVNQTWSEWMNTFPPLFGIFCLLGLAFSFFPFEKKRYQTHLALASAVFIAAELGLHRPGLATKLWVFLFPLGIIWVSAGWAGLASRLGRAVPDPKRFALAAALLTVTALMALNITRFTRVLPAWFAPPGPNEATALEIQGLLQPGDIVITGSPADAAVMYYLEIHGVSRAVYTKLKNKPFQRAFVVTYDPYEQTVTEIISNWGPNIDLFEAARARLLANHGPDSLYLVLPKGITPPPN